MWKLKTSKENLRTSGIIFRTSSEHLESNIVNVFQSKQDFNNHTYMLDDRVDGYLKQNYFF